MAEHVAFRRDIGLFMAVMIGIGAMMGPGIFALPGEVAGIVGPVGMFAYLAMGLLTVFTALSYGELGAALPLAGGGYSFASRLLPAPVAFLTGWFFWIGNALACSMYALIFSLTVRDYFWPGANVALVGLATTLLFAALNVRGMGAALKVITAMNLLELGVLVGFAVLAYAQVEPPNLQPFAPVGLGPFLPAMALVYVSFVGFDLITVASEEIIDPGRTIPRAILITLFLGIAIYVGVVGVMMGVVPRGELAGSDVPFVLAADRVFGPWGRWAGVVATIMASLSALSVTLGASGRILYALGRDGHFPAVFARLHRRYRTPHIALILCAGVVAAFAASGVVRLVASVAGFGYLLGQGVVNIAAIELRRRMPNLRRPFKVMLFPVVPLLGAATSWALVPALEPSSLALGLLLTLAGGGLYLARPSNRQALRRLPAATRRLLLRIRAKRRKPMRVLIIGGGKQGQNIADRLQAHDEYRLLFRVSSHQVTFIEEDESLCRELEQRYSVPIYTGDGTKKELLEQVGPENVDVAIAASEDDGRNVIAALQARRVGIPRVMAIVQDPDYVALLEENQVVAVSAPWATAAIVENYLDRPGVADLFEIEGGIASLVSVTIPPDARVLGKRIKDIAIPEECVVAAVIRADEFVVPRGGTAIAEDDHVVFVGPAPAIKRAQEVFRQTA